LEEAEAKAKKEQEPEAEKEQKKEAPNREQEPPKIRFTMFHESEITLSNEPDYRIYNVLPNKGLGLVYGEHKSGKSFFTYDLVMHVARNIPYRDHDVVGGTVIYIAAEGESGFDKRIEAYRRRHQHKTSNFFIIKQCPNLVLDHPALIKDIKTQVPGEMPAIIVLDTLNRTLAGSESSDKDMPAYIAAAGAIEREFNCLVLLVHHCGWEKGRPRGHTSLPAAVVVQIMVQRDGGGNVVATVERAKDMEAGGVFTSKLDRVELGADRRGNMMTTCVIEPTNAAAAKPAEAKLTKNQATMFRILHEAGKAGLTTGEWNERAREAGLGVSRPATLTDIRADLRDKNMVREYGDRWFVNHTG
jgi:hypothetical protein